MPGSFGLLRGGRFSTRTQMDNDVINWLAGRDWGIKLLNSDAIGGCVEQQFVIQNIVNLTLNFRQRLPADVESNQLKFDRAFGLRPTLIVSESSDLRADNVAIGLFHVALLFPR